MDIGIIFSEFIMQVIFPILGAIILIFISMTTRKLDKKFSTDIFSNNIKIIEDIALRAVDFAEEYASNKAKTRGKITGQEKLDLAIGFLMERMPTISREQAQDWIESMLQSRRE